MKKIMFFLVVFTSFIFSLSPVLADEEIRQLYVDLKAKGFADSTYVDELKSSVINFGPNDKYQLQLRITNAGNRNQTNIKVRQVFPSFVTTDSAPNFTISQIAAGQDYVRNIVVTVKNKSSVPAVLTRGLITTTATSEIGTKAEDSLAFYVGNGTYSPQSSTTSATVLPKTGNSTLIISTTLVLATLGISLYLRRLARGY